ncbi:MAG: hypothetical protein WA916_06270, partial [Arcobacter sp.]
MIKKILLSTIFTVTIVLGSESLTSYDQAVKLFNEKAYEKAYEIFLSLSKNDLENQNLNFYLGR